MLKSYSEANVSYLVFSCRLKDPSVYGVVLKIINLTPEETRGERGIVPRCVIANTINGFVSSTYKSAKEARIANGVREKARFKIKKQISNPILTVKSIPDNRSWNAK